jgi:hypothetical protein
MSQTFEQAMNAPTQGEIQLEETRRTLRRTVDAIQEKLKQVRKARRGWDNRLNAVHARRVLAARRGVRHPRLEWIIDEVAGGNMRTGILPCLESHAEAVIAEIALIKAVPAQQTLCYLQGEPERIEGNVRTIEERLSEMETIVKDGGELQRMKEAKAGHPDPVMSTPRREEPNEIKVDI